MGAQHRARGVEYARLGAAEPIDRLLGIADDEHARPIAIVAVGVQPRTHHLPLQRIGVLELVDQHMTVARINARMQISRMFGIRQQFPCMQLQIGEVQLAAIIFQPLVMVDAGLADHEHGLVEPPYLQVMGTLAVFEQLAGQLRPGIDRGLRGLGSEFFFQILGHLYGDGLAGLGQADAAQCIKALDTAAIADPGLDRACRLLLGLGTLPKRLGEFMKALAQFLVLPEREPRITFTVFREGETIPEPVRRIARTFHDLPFGALGDESLDHFSPAPVASDLIDRHQGIAQITMLGAVEGLHEFQPGLLT